MPLYDLLAIVRAQAPRLAVSDILRRAAVSVLDAGGVVTDVKSFGTRTLAYEIQRAGEKHTQGQYVQLSFATQPAALATLQHDLRTDERVVRWLLVKQPALAPLPKVGALRRLEQELLAQDAAGAVHPLEAEPSTAEADTEAQEAPSEPAAPAAASKRGQRGGVRARARSTKPREDSRDAHSESSGQPPE